VEAVAYLGDNRLGARDKGVRRGHPRRRGSKSRGVCGSDLLWLALLTRVPLTHSITNTPLSNLNQI
jgi:hypothetical protein